MAELCSRRIQGVLTLFCLDGSLLDSLLSVSPPLTRHIELVLHTALSPPYLPYHLYIPLYRSLYAIHDLHPDGKPEVI